MSAHLVLIKSESNEDFVRFRLVLRQCLLCWIICWMERGWSRLLLMVFQYFRHCSSAGKSGNVVSQHHCCTLHTCYSAGWMCSCSIYSPQTQLWYL